MRSGTANLSLVYFISSFTRHGSTEHLLIHSELKSGTDKQEIDCNKDFARTMHSIIVFTIFINLKARSFLFI